MKKVLLSTFLFLVLVTTATAQENATSDYALVEQTVGYYLDGGTNRDVETLKKAFHESAKIRYLTAKGYNEANCLEFFGGMKPGPKQDRKTRVVSIDVSGYAASAKLEIEYPTFTFVDYMTLMKIENEWKIVAKVSYRRNHDTE